MGKVYGKKLKYKGAGRGDKRRPVDREKYEKNYDAIFRKKNG